MDSQQGKRGDEVANVEKFVPLPTTHPLLEHDLYGTYTKLYLGTSRSTTNNPSNYLIVKRIGG